MRKTKIVCTLGPATDSEEKISELIEAGCNIFRINMSHAVHGWVYKVVQSIRKVATKKGKVVGILLDTQGPAIRTGDLSSPLHLKMGNIVEFTVRGTSKKEVYSVDVNYNGLAQDVSVGSTLLVDNGVIRMQVLAKQENRIRCKVLTPGILRSRRHINLPGVRVSIPPLTEKDLADIKLGMEIGVDFVALSFCREASDIQELRKILRQHGSVASIIAKIEDQHAVQVIDEIIREADAIMLARGDLGIECPMEELPIIQRSVTRRCLQIGRPVIVATHMLESMTKNPLPTRAEIIDVAYAVFEQVDAIMLSGETSIGRYPVECVRTFDQIACRVESDNKTFRAQEMTAVDCKQELIKSAIVLANSLPNSKLIVFTRRGVMAYYVSHLRLIGTSVFAFSPNEEVVRQLMLNWNIFPIHMPFASSPDHTVTNAENLLKQRGLIQTGDQLVIVSDILIGGNTFHSIQLRTVF
ncbi:Pyruvate kinase [Candidatus Xiphinematobacter sp. Idaho Grape]|uniref:pyruvate kinase n=1 Tax=Candidatus Xiphinematobacter sp. Idaho Grape TaxID=1704307 RepID=UPI0007063811|nr:pyruvate kinase [Candidatus Xiphinematobacter sp. Idaho Grape]ALJ56506.1 Pyruvate kinase [Candidatus Xiphinematobacter sp. Idaho Grape]